MKGRPLPIDERLFDWLQNADMQRRFKDVDEKKWAEEFDRQLRAEDAAGEAARQAKLDEADEEMEKRLAHAIRLGERGRRAYDRDPR